MASSHVLGFRKKLEAAKILNPADVMHDLLIPPVVADQGTFCKEVFSSLFRDQAYTLFIGEEHMADMEKRSFEVFSQKKAFHPDSFFEDVLQPLLENVTVSFSASSHTNIFDGGARGSADAAATTSTCSCDINELKEVAKILDVQFYQVWMKLKSNGQVDAGVLFCDLCDSPWELVQLANILLPPHEDTFHVLQHIHSHMWKVSALGFSLFRKGACIVSAKPWDLNPSSRLLSSFFFFRELGFIRPGDGVIIAVSRARPDDFFINFYLGEQGLIKTHLQLEMRNKDSVEMLTKKQILPSNHTGKVFGIKFRIGVFSKIVTFSYYYSCCRYF